MNAEEKIQHIKDLGKARAKSYYERNKQKILEKRKIEREKLNEQIKLIKETKKIPVTETIEADEPVVGLSPTADYTREDIVNLIKQQGYEYKTQKHILLIPIAFLQ